MVQWKKDTCLCLTSIQPWKRSRLSEKMDSCTFSSCHKLSQKYSAQHLHARTHTCTHSHTGFFRIIWYIHGGLFQSSPQNFVAHLECPSFSAINSWVFKCECLQVCLSTECMPRAQSPEDGHGYTGGWELPSTGNSGPLQD